MQVILPDHLKNDDDFKRAFRWVSDELKYDSKQNADEMIEEAIHRFDLALTGKVRMPDCGWNDV